jgi:hypothetical protein
VMPVSKPVPTLRKPPLLISSMWSCPPLNTRTGKRTSCNIKQKFSTEAGKRQVQRPAEEARSLGQNSKELREVRASGVGCDGRGFSKQTNPLPFTDSFTLGIHSLSTGGHLTQTRAPRGTQK